MKKSGHISDHMSLLDIAKKHGITDSELRSELKKGIKVKQEHTSNIKAATRIALDHLFEDPKYYTKLAKSKLEENILSEYSGKIINQLIDKFKQEKPNLAPNTIQSYIERFSQIKDSPRVSEKDILKYSWKELETIVDSNQPKRIKAGKINDGEPNSDANLVYNQNGLRIYLGKDKKSCIKYGNGYSFCISARGGNNMYNDYRYEQKGTPYFVFDDTKSSEQDENGDFIDPTHLLVIFVYDDVFDFDEYDDTTYILPIYYTVTTANNPGEDKYNGFNYVENKYPRLKGLRNVFRGVEPENKEKAEYELELEYDNKVNTTNREFENLWQLDPEQNYFTFSTINSAVENINNFINNKISPYRFSGKLKPTANPDDYISSGVAQYRNVPIGGNPEKERKDFMEDIIASMYDGPGDSKESIKNWDVTYTKENISTPEYKWYFNQIKRLVDTYNNKTSQLNLVKENQSLKNKSSLNKELVKEFMKHVTKELKLNSLPKIKFSDDSQEAVTNGSWGGYRTGDKSIRIVTAKRHPADIFRTLAHELVHYKQDVTGRLNPGDGKTGSDVENEANSRAAIIMRNFAQAKPKLFEHLITELGEDLSNALPFTYVGGKYNEYRFKTEDNEYTVAFKPDGESTYERVYHTTNRPLGSNFEDTQEGKPLQINSTVMVITLDFMKRNPDFYMIYIVPLDRRRFNLVSAYIKNSLPSQYSFEAESNDGEDIIIIHNSPN